MALAVAVGKPSGRSPPGRGSVAGDRSRAARARGRPEERCSAGPFSLSPWTTPNALRSDARVHLQALKLPNHDDVASQLHSPGGNLLANRPRAQ
jgi:hypothetical protein